MVGICGTCVYNRFDDEYPMSKVDVLETYADLYDEFDDYKELQRKLDKVYDKLRDLPSVTPKRKCGKWNVYYHGINETPSFTYSCNQCGYSAPYGLYGGKYSQKEWNFCPNCGADMRGGEQDD